MDPTQRQQVDDVYNVPLPATPASHSTRASRPPSTALAVALESQREGAGMDQVPRQQVDDACHVPLPATPASQSMTGSRPPSTAPGADQEFQLNDPPTSIRSRWSISESGAEHIKGSMTWRWWWPFKRNERRHDEDWRPKPIKQQSWSSSPLKRLQWLAA